jgi:F-type H+-transporting ATPase subunit b
MELIIQTFGIDWKILLVQIVNFSLLLGALSYFLYKPLTKLIEARRAQIIQGVADAERAESALKDADAKKAEILTHAALESERMVAVAREHAKTEEAGILVSARERSERLVREAELKGEEIRQDALRKSKEDMARLIVLGVEKTLRSRTS